MESGSGRRRPDDGVVIPCSVGFRKVDEWKDGKESILREIQETDLDALDLVRHVHQAHLDLGLLGEGQGTDVHVGGPAGDVEEAEVDSGGVLLQDVEDTGIDALGLTSHEVGERAEAAIGCALDVGDGEKRTKAMEVL